MDTITLLGMAAPAGSEGARSSMLPMLFYMLLWSIGIGLVCYRIAEQKGRRVFLAVVLGLIPLVNFIAVIYLIGATNKRAEEQLDEILIAVKALTKAGVPKPVQE